MGYFDGCVFCSVGFLRRSSFMWFSDIEAQGGTCSWTFDEHITHLVCSPSDVSSNPTVVSAINSGTCWIVSEEFLEQCTSQGKRLNENDFLLAPAPKSPPSKGAEPLPSSPLASNVSSAPLSSGYVSVSTPSSSSSSANYVDTQAPPGYASFSFSSTPSSSRDPVPSGPSSWPPQFAAQKAKEDELRQRFASGVNVPADPYEHLINVFESRPFDQPAQPCPPLPLIQAPGSLQLHPVSSLSAFQANWSEQTKNVLSGLDWNNVFAAGGSVFSALTNCPDSARGGDIDLFIYGLSPDAATQKLESIANALMGGNTKSVVRTRHAVTILGQFPAPHVQVVLRLYKSPAEVLIGFDIDSCCFGFNGQSVFALPRAIRAVQNKFNMVDLTRRSPSYEYRLWKYAKRGLAIAYPELDRSRVMSGFYNPNRQSTGLGKLLLLEWKTPEQAGPAKTNLFGISKDESEALLPTKGLSDYDLSVIIPYGPNWSPSSILRLLYRKAQSNFFARKARNGGSPSGHLVVTGWESVLSGKQSSLESVGPPPAESHLVYGPLSWVTQNPGQQGLLTGSFNPLPAEGWETDAYAVYDGTRGQIPPKPFAKAHAPLAKFKAAKPIKATKPVLLKKSTVKAVKAVKQFAASKPKFPTQKIARPSKTAAPKIGAKFGFSGPVQETSPPSKFGSKSGFSAPVQETPAPSWGANAGGWGAPKPSTAWGAPKPSNDWGQPAAPAANNNPFESFKSKPSPSPFSAPKPAPVGNWSSPPSASTANSVVETPKSPLGKLLLLVSMLAKGSYITEQQRTQIKTKIIQQDENCFCALEVFEMDQDFSELADTLIRIISL